MKVGTADVEYNTISFFLEGLFKTSFGDIIVGGRYDNHDEYSGVFVPRFGVTKVMDDFHFKVLACRAYRAPSILNIDYEQNHPSEEEIDPEFTTVFEADVGYVMKDNIFLTFNVYNIDVEDMIVYQEDPADAYHWWYENGDCVTSQGFDLECKIRETWGYVSMAYSYNQISDNDIEAFQAYEDDGDEVTLGFPTHIHLER